ncbi:MAG TPA: VanW family protein, partial [Armatimonadota bacterium]|jgi:vancomycin resistance protein YoaR
VLHGNTIYPGVRVDRTDLGGLTLRQGRHRISEAAEKIGAEKVVLKYPQGQIVATASELGEHIDVDTTARTAWSVGRKGNVLQRLSEILSARRDGAYLPLIHGYGTQRATAYLRRLGKQLDQPATDARLVADGESVSVIPEKTGSKLDIGASLSEIEKSVNSGVREVALSIVTAMPDVSSGDLSGIDGVLARYSTRYRTSQRDRSHNLKLACRMIDGTIIKPGCVFSYNKTVGPRLKKYGFRDAPIFVKGEVEPGTGGGICQVCTTLYNAALLANLKIVRRSHHSMPVHYAPVGRDATVAWPSIDLKLGNPTDTPAYIAASLSRGRVNVTIFGRKQETLVVKLESSDHEVIPPKVVEVTADEAREHDPPHSGHRITVYRIVKMEDEVEKRELISRDYYRPGNKYVASASRPAEGVSRAPKTKTASAEKAKGSSAH